MTILIDLLNRLEKIVSLEDEEAIFEKIRETAHKDRQAFIEEVRKLPLDGTSLLSYVYEALSWEVDAWDGFFLEELERVLTLARTSPNPAAVLSPLDEFYLLGLDDDDPMRNRMRERLYEHLDDSHPSVRRKCVLLLEDFIDRTNLGELSKLTQMARSDPDWRVRYQAHRILAEVWPDRSRQVKLPLWIRIKGKLLNPNAV